MFLGVSVHSPYQLLDCLLDSPLHEMMRDLTKGGKLYPELIFVQPIPFVTVSLLSLNI